LGEGGESEEGYNKGQGSEAEMTEERHGTGLGRNSTAGAAAI
jgi:hypothetical protein